MRISDWSSDVCSSDLFEATLVWMADEAMIPGRAYWLKLATQSVSATVQAPKYEINVNTLDHLAAKTLDLNGIGVVELSTNKPIVFESYADNHTLGGDRKSTRLNSSH